MSRFVVEEYAVSGGADGLARTARRALEAGAALAEEGRTVRHERSVLLVEDRVALHFFEAEAIGDVTEAARRAAIACDRLHAVHEAGGGTACRP